MKEINIQNEKNPWNTVNLEIKLHRGTGKIKIILWGQKFTNSDDKDKIYIST